MAFFIGNAFVTNVFFIPWFAMRECQREPARDAVGAEATPRLPLWAPATAAVALAVGVFSVGWAAMARPEVGGLADRWQYYLTSVTSDRCVAPFVLVSSSFSLACCYKMQS